MDRTGWSAVALCAVALVLWQVYVVKKTQNGPRPTAMATATPAASISPAPSAPVTNSPAALASPGGGAVPVQSQPLPSSAAAPATFTEVTETLRNADVELHLTNRGGGIARAVLLNHVAENNTRVTLNSGSDHLPIGAIIDNPAAPDLAEYKVTRVGDAVQLDRVAGEIAIRKKFSFPATPEKQDNFVAEMAVDLTNNSTAPYSNPGYYLALGSAVQIHANDYPTYTRLVWCVNGSAKGIDVGWFAGGGGILGIGQRDPRPLYNETVKSPGAEWAAVSDQFFTTLIAPLDAKSDMVWARRFGVDPEQKIHGIEGAMHMPGFQLQPGQTYTAKFDIYSGPKLYHRLATLSHNEAEIMEFGIFKIVCQTLLNALNTLHQFHRQLRRSHPRAHRHRKSDPMADSKQGEPFGAPDGCVVAEDAGVAREI